MAFLTLNMSTSAQEQTKNQVQRTECLPDGSIPHGPSVIPTTSAESTFFCSNLGKQTTLDPEAPWFGCEGNMLPNNASYPGGFMPIYNESTARLAFTTNDDLRWILMGAHARITMLEESTAAANSSLGQLGAALSDILSRLTVLEQMCNMINDLKQNLGEFTRNLIPHFLGENREDDVEKQG